MYVRSLHSKIYSHDLRSCRWNSSHKKQKPNQQYDNDTLSIHVTSTIDTHRGDNSKPASARRPVAGSDFTQNFWEVIKYCCSYKMPDIKVHYHSDKITPANKATRSKYFIGNPVPIRCWNNPGWKWKFERRREANNAFDSLLHLRREHFRLGQKSM